MSETAPSSDVCRRYVRSRIQAPRVEYRGSTGTSSSDWPGMAARRADPQRGRAHALRLEREGRVGDGLVLGTNPGVGDREDNCSACAREGVVACAASGRNERASGDGEGPAGERGPRRSSQGRRGERGHQVCAEPSAALGSEGSSRTTGVLNAWGREEGVRCVVLAWKVIVSFRGVGCDIRTVPLGDGAVEAADWRLRVRPAPASRGPPAPPGSARDPSLSRTVAARRRTVWHAGRCRRRRRSWAGECSGAQTGLRWSTWTGTRRLGTERRPGRFPALVRSIGHGAAQITLATTALA
jgi:hypothetical protein